MKPKSRDITTHQPGKSTRRTVVEARKHPPKACTKCGTKHGTTDQVERCPAATQICYKCKGRAHYARRCTKEAYIISHPLLAVASSEDTKRAISEDELPIKINDTYVPTDTTRETTAAEGNNAITEANYNEAIKVDPKEPERMEETDCGPTPETRLESENGQDIKMMPAGPENGTSEKAKTKQICTSDEESSKCRIMKTTTCPMSLRILIVKDAQGIIPRDLGGEMRRHAPSRPGLHHLEGSKTYVACPESQSF